MARPVICLKARALRYLSAREHSRIELARKLARHAQEGDDIEQLLDALEADKFLSNTRFCNSLIKRRAKRSGNSRILAELESHGIGGPALSEVRSELVDGETARACDAWQRKFSAPGRDLAERSKQMRFMLQRGFSQPAIRIAMQGSVQSDDDFIETPEAID